MDPAPGGVWRVSVVGKTVVPRTTTLAYALAQARAWAESGWPAFVTKRNYSTRYRDEQIEITRDLRVVVHLGDPQARWIAQARHILEQTRS